jgi:hypothetical protein
MPKSRGCLGLENNAEVDRDPRLLQRGFFLVFRGSAGPATGSAGVFPREPERLIHSRCEAETHPQESRHRGRAPPVIQPEANHSRHREPQGNCGDFRGQLEGYCEPRTRLPLLVHARLPPPPRSSSAPSRHAAGRWCRPAGRSRARPYRQGTSRQGDDGNQLLLANFPMSTTQTPVREIFHKVAHRAAVRERKEQEGWKRRKTS